MWEDHDWVLKFDINQETLSSVSMFFKENGSDLFIPIQATKFFKNHIKNTDRKFENGEILCGTCSFNNVPQKLVS